MFRNGKNGYFIRCTFINALNVDYSPDFFISVVDYAHSETESEYLNLTLESRSGETRIKYVYLNMLDRIRCTPNGWICDKETWHMTSVDIQYFLNQLKMERAN